MSQNFPLQLKFFRLLSGKAYITDTSDIRWVCPNVAILLTAVSSLNNLGEEQIAHNNERVTKSKCYKDLF